ncbi:MAG: hypothetical protein HY762_02485 [Planctomycetes bacterium]|nr:hypothetical protein [Planctomycetota bacterium]
MKIGTTLLELMIATVILLIILGAIFAILISANDAFTTGTINNDLARDALLTINNLTDNIPECDIRNPSTYTTSLEIVVPVSNATAAYWSDAGAINWGAVNPNNNIGITGAYIKYYFEQYAGPPNEPAGTLNESDNPGTDWNRDRDVNDSFLFGKMVEVIIDPASAPVTKSHRVLCHNVLLTNPAGGDIDNDGSNDPIFTTIGVDNTININLWLGGKLGAQQIPVIVNERTRIMLLNPPKDDN